MRLIFTVPICTRGGLNARENHFERARRVKAERNAISYRFPVFEFEPAVHVHLVRLGPRELDSDNLPGALKGVRDAIAAKLRLDDACRLIDWSYSQERGEPGVRVELEAKSKADK